MRPTELSDYLIERAKSGDKKAFIRVVTPYQLELTKLVSLIVCEHSTSELIVVDALTSAFKKLKNLDENKKIKIWIYRCVIESTRAVDIRNLAEKMLYKKRILHIHPQEQIEFQNPENRGDPIALNLCHQKTILSALSQLDWQRRSALVLKDACALNYAEISEILNLDTNLVKNQIFLAREEISQKVIDYAESLRQSKDF